ncbi:MAG: sigma-70 family RNA polymerase sigma factor [Planctomycetota bacterium]|jgi:RNA polymerase sigma factor for flagellar operon FliA
MPVETENITKPKATAQHKAEKPALGTPKDNRRHLSTAALRAYSRQKTPSVTSEQITDLLPMVRRIVHRVITYLKPPLTFEDLVSAGVLGLVKAAHDFDPSYEVEFKTYAYTKIKGAILDQLRSWSFVPANLNKQIRSAMKLAQNITEQTGTPPTDAQLAEKLGITVDKLHGTLESARAKHFVSIDAFEENTPALGVLLTAANTATPIQQIVQTELIDKLTEAIQQLTKRQRQIILLYYQQHLTMKQIADVFNITEPRISQLHARALFNLAVKLRQWKDGR